MFPLALIPPPDELLRRAVALSLLCEIAQQGFVEHSRAVEGIEVDPRTHPTPYYFQWYEERGILFFDDLGGDLLRIIFTPSDGAVIHGFAHEGPMSPWVDTPPRVWPKMFDGMPARLRDSLTDIVPQAETVTHCFWWAPNANEWTRGVDTFPGTTDAFRDDPEGAGWMLEHLVCDPDLLLTTAYVSRGYAHCEVEDVRRLFAHDPLSDELIRRLNSHADAAAIRELAQTLRYGASVMR